VVDLAWHWIGLLALLIFLAAYAVAMAEERLQLRKSIPMLAAAAGIWIVIGMAASQRGQTEPIVAALRHDLLDFAELFLFLIVAMTYVNTMAERGVFDALRVWLIGRRLSLRGLFWVTGGLAFLMSPIADNLTTALVLGAVAMAVGVGRPRFVTLACINIVVAANAGGAFSPFGDITTLMVWQAGHVSFTGFLPLFLPSLVNWLVPAFCLAMAVERARPESDRRLSQLAPGALGVVLLFLLSIALTVALHNTLHLPPAIGMMAGLGLLKIYGELLNRRQPAVTMQLDDPSNVFAASPLEAAPSPPTTTAQPARPLDVFHLMERIEWDTLLFFYGVILSVGGLGTLGYLALTSQALYERLGPTLANVIVGLLSAVIDNIPVMFAVLSMKLTLSQGEWLLVTLTTGVGGSLLSIGSAAGVALMGQATGRYTFLAHLRWSWAIALGYAASIGLHLLLNRSLF
jgi:Na+/H+ antiporter NhaD/arsenite permease-like protein